VAKGALVAVTGTLRQQVAQVIVAEGAQGVAHQEVALKSEIKINQRLRSGKRELQRGKRRLQIKRTPPEGGVKAAKQQ
jgi:hypothetical protein